ncbi:F510_1955 family glycosylhydrolase [uncultured Pseudokineococcus sp.]|uniref:F510_1955 family glycosylhydrolase n=1 Tax=uncultured Pseudokineococcus sp. TaxID=1642928 RepID=UPI00261A7655|nr:exo-alpha-sialidase [uncultured Pseudokineococcus sp.]
MTTHPLPLAVAAALTLGLAGCGATTQDAAQTRAALEQPATTEPPPTTEAALPSAHVHGVGTNPADGAVVLATHDGLFRDDDGSWTSVGPGVDLMGFAVAGPDHFYASGHPGPGTDLPNPVGLIESTDGGLTWTPRSREGASDFHAMAAHAGGVIGFDGTLRATSDEVTWTTVEAPVEPFALAASGQAETVVATSPQGPALSVDAGATWTTLRDAPLLLLAAVADDATLVGVTTAGDVVVSEDTGATWEQRGSLGEPPQAVSAVRAEDGSLQVLAVTDELLVSTDGGATFAPR